LRFHKILSAIEPHHFVQIEVPLFQRFSKCLSGSHFQVCEKTLAMWNNEYIFNLICDNLDVILPIVFAPLYYNSKHHWNKAVRPMAWYALKMFMEYDPDVFHASVRQFKEQRSQARQRNYQYAEKWSTIATLAATAELDRLTIQSGPATASTPSPVYAIGAGQASPIPTERPRRLSVDLNTVSISALYTQHQPLLSAADQQTQASLMRLADDDFSLEDPEIQALTQAKNPRARRKSLLPMDPQAVQALRSHLSLEEMARQRVDFNAIDSEGDIEDEFRALGRQNGNGSDSDLDDLAQSFSESESSLSDDDESDEYDQSEESDDSRVGPHSQSESDDDEPQ
jgi:hypothetical protein